MNSKTKINKNNNIKGIILIILSAFLIAAGQFLWKLAAGHLNLYLLSGFILYGLGAVMMITALKYGDLSVLHPMMSVSYIFAMVLSFFVLKESVNYLQISGMFAIIFGAIMLGTEKGKTC